MKKDFTFKDSYNFADLVAIMHVLRSDGGCPWDMEQSHASIRNDFIEETYEAVEAIDNNDTEALTEELGDVLLQVVFHAEIAASEGKFDIDTVADGICKKLIHRHPHVFGNVSVSSSEEVVDNWTEIKKEEKNQKTPKDELNAVAKSLPSLMRGEKMMKRAEKSGLLTNDKNEDIRMISEISSSMSENLTAEEAKDRMGRLLMYVCALGRKTGTDCEQSLYEACERLAEDGRF